MKKLRSHIKIFLEFLKLRNTVPFIPLQIIILSLTNPMNFTCQWLYEVLQKPTLVHYYLDSNFKTHIKKLIGMNFTFQNML